MEVAARPSRIRYGIVSAAVIVALMSLNITLLGAPRVQRDGETVTFDTRKAMALLAHLALAERPRSREALCSLLWPAHDLDRARGALRRTLSTLRKGIGDEWIDASGDSLAIRKGPGLELDVERFRALAADGAAEESLSQAAALFSGDFLEGFSLRDSPDFDDWQMGEAGALERELASALRRLVELLVSRGDIEHALPRAQRWLELDPLHEPAHRELIRLYAWSGDRAAALEQYRTCVRTLSRGAVVLSARCHDDEAGIPYGPLIELLGQAVALAESDAWPNLLSPQRLADASLLLPELAGLGGDRPAALPRDGPGAQVRLLEGVAAVISAASHGPEPGIVFLDDVHAADEATVEAISYLGRRLRGRALLLLLAWRSERVPPGHRLRRLAVDLSRDGRAGIVNPRRLIEVAVVAVVQAAYPPPSVPDLEQRVYLESEGLPLFVAEYIAARHAGYEGTGETLPAEVRGLLDARLAGLGDVPRQVLGAAAVIGRSFDLDSVRQASGRSDEETVAALEALVDQGLVREVPGPDPVYDFSHQQLRARVYEKTGRARRRLLHARVAAALSGPRPDGESAALHAQHLRLAGDHARAAEHYRLAAEHAASLHAHANALDQLEQALALGYPDAAEVHERIGDLRTLLGDYGGALAAYESAAALCEPGALAAIEHKIGGVHQRRGEWERAEARFLAALEAVPDGDPGLRARIQADLSLTFHHAGRPERADTLAREALELAEVAADLRAQAQAHNMLGVLARNRGDAETALEQLGCSLELGRELDEAPAQAAALNNLALVRRDAGELPWALELTEKALALCVGYGDRHREAALENNLADLHHAAGDEVEAMAHLKRAVAIFR